MDRALAISHTQLRLIGHNWLRHDHKSGYHDFPGDGSPIINTFWHEVLIVLVLSETVLVLSETVLVLVIEMGH